MSSVRLYYIKHQGEKDLEKIDEAQIASWLAALSLQKKTAVQRLLHYRNRVASLSGLQLLNQCAQDEGVEDFALGDVEYPETGKPFWKNDHATFDFNITHSGNFILLAASTALKVGVDVEEIRPLKRLSFKMVMSPQELAAIEQQPSVFFDLWSKKEAVVKAADTTGIARMRDVLLKPGQAVLDDSLWWLKTIDLDEQYAINLATSAPVDELIVKQVSLASLT